MYGKNRLINFFAAVMVVAAFSIMSACSQIQSLTIAPQSASCVQPSMYCANGTSGCLNETLAIANFPVIAKNPTQAPYCMSFTIKNNNSSSQSGSNMQITYPGLVLTGFPNESSTTFTMMDPIASAESEVITNQTQVTGNVALFDPNNCATIGGANSITIQGGQSCTFYLQIINEAYPPNTYPISLQYSSYNANTTNTIIANIYEHVTLYGGTNSGLYENQTSGTNTAQWVNNGINAPTSKIGSIITDSYGNLYFASNTQVYMYNGLHLINLGSPLPSNVNSLAFDLNGNLYAGTNGSGVYLYNKSSTPPNWVVFTDTNGNLNSSSIITGITSTGFTPNSGNQNLYVTTFNQAYKCSIAPSLTTIATSCAFTNISSLPDSPPIFNANAISSDNLGVYLGSNANVFTYIQAQNSWQQFTFPGATITGTVASIFHQTVSSVPYTYVGFANSTNANESAIFNCNANFSCSSAIRTSGTATVSGNVNSIAADGDGDLFIGGNMLNSPDFASTPNVSGAYLYYTSGSTNTWQPIINGKLPPNTNISAITVSSSLLGQ